MAKRVYLFNEGSKDDRELLGGKGANLCEMTNLGLPVPYGFVITTPTCREFFQAGNRLPNLLEQEYRVALDLVEKRTGRPIHSWCERDLDPRWQLAHGEAIGLGSRDYELRELSTD